MKKISPLNSNQKRAVVSILLSDKVEFKILLKVTRDKEKLYTDKPFDNNYKHICT